MTSFPRTYLSIFFLGVVVFIVWYSDALFRKGPASSDESTTRVQEERWKSRITDIGASRAYEEFALSVAAATPEKQHDGAHAFGGALFRTKGVSGLSTCDARFSYGCFHEFLGRAIAELGLSSVLNLNEGCQKALVTSPLSCQHGIGHGIVSALGYDESSMEKALEVCRDLPYMDPIGGCYGGVFMEYNLQTMLLDKGHTRPIVASNMQEPCDRLPDAFKRACTFWQVQWWHQVSKNEGKTEQEIFPEIGKLCDAVPADLQRTCYEGLGNITAPAADFDAARSVHLCELSSENSKDRLFCRSYAANSLSLGGAGKVGDGEAVCKGLSGEDRSYCEAYARNEANLLIPRAVPNAL